jgi:anti-sigma regulatory factor (Ser/Thr protein kinase)
VIRLDTSVSILDASAAGEARHTASAIAYRTGMSDTGSARAALVATEFATNIVKHAGEGIILFGCDDERPCSVVIVALDSAGGIPSVAAAMRDGFSTAGSPGTGLGAVARASASFDLYSQPGHGTALVSIVAEEPASPGAGPLVKAPRMSVAGICLPLRGHEVSGDAWAARAALETLTLFVADGLGHGEGASMASVAAVRSFLSDPDASTDQILQDAHGMLRSGRGAAVGLTRIHMTEGRAEFAGVGNIGAAIAMDDATRRLVSLNGIVGHEMRKVQTFSYPWTADSVLIMQSDGVSLNWNLANYPGLLQKESVMIAAVLFRDGRRTTDDATIVVARAS